MSLMVLIDLDRHHCKVGKRRVAKRGIVAMAAHTHFEDVGNFKSPKPGYPYSRSSCKFEDVENGRGCFLAVHPRQRRGRIENEAHGLPASRSALSVPQSKGLVLSRAARIRMRPAAACACVRSMLAEFETTRATVCHAG